MINWKIYNNLKNLTFRFFSAKVISCHTASKPNLPRSSILVRKSSNEMEYLFWKSPQQNEEIKDFSQGFFDKKLDFLRKEMVS